MTADIYYNNYPIIKSDQSFMTDQSSYHLFIKDFHDGLIRNGLIRVDVPGQTSIDVNNMVSVDLMPHYMTLTGVPDHTKFYSAGDLFFTFNDELNNVHPLIIKFSFDYINLYRASVEVSKIYAAVNVGITVYKKNDESLVEIIPFTYVGPRISVTSGNTGNLVTSGTSLTTEMPYVKKDKSFINNIGNILNISICPRIMYYVANRSIANHYGDSIFSKPDYYFYSPLVKFILNRRQDGSVIFKSNSTSNISGSNWGYTSGSIQTANLYKNYVNFLYVPSNSTVAEPYIPTSAISIFKNSVLEVTDNYNNKELMVFPLEFYSLSESKVVQSYDFLVAADYRLLPTAFPSAIVKINIDGIGEQSYRVINSLYCQNMFDSTGNIALLVKDE